MVSAPACSPALLLLCCGVTGQPLTSLCTCSFLFTCPNVLDGNVGRAKDAFYHESVECQSWLGNVSTPVI